jgi:hypothetical protein
MPALVSLQFNACGEGGARAIAPPGHQTDAGSLADILVGRNATRWLCFVGVAANLRAILAAHIPFQFVDCGRLRPAHDIQRHRPMGVGAKASDLEIAGIPRCRGIPTKENSIVISMPLET